eukprot:1154832-Pelagomonas_calceolata.AAC.11
MLCFYLNFLWNPKESTVMHQNLVIVHPAMHLQRLYILNHHLRWPCFPTLALLMRLAEVTHWGSWSAVFSFACCIVVVITIIQCLLQGLLHRNLPFSPTHCLVQQTWPRTAAASPFAAASLHHGFPSTQWSSDTTSSSSSSSSASIPGSPPSHALSRAQANEQSDNAIKAAGNNEAVVPGAGVPLPGPGSPYGAGGGWLREWGGQQRAAVKEGCGVGWGMHGVPTKQQQQQQQQQQQHASAEEHANALHGSPIKRHATQLQRSADDALPKDVSASTEQNQMVDLPSDVHSLAPGPLPSRNLPPRLMLLQAPHSKPLHAPPAATSTPPSSQSPFSSVSPFLQIQGFRGPLSSTPPVAHAPPATPSGSFQHLAHPIEHTPCTSIAPLPPVTSQLERQGNSQLSRSLSYPASTPSPILRPPASNPPAPTKLVRKSTSANHKRSGYSKCRAAHGRVQRYATGPPYFSPAPVDFTLQLIRVENHINFGHGAGALRI